MAEYNPSKIIKDGNTYNFRDTTKIPLSGSNAISGSLIPSTNGTVNLGTPSYRWKDVQTEKINGINPSALSLPNPSNTISLDTTNWDLTNYTENSYTSPADGWIMLGGFADVIQIDGSMAYGITVNKGYDGYCEAFLPVLKNHLVRCRFRNCTILNDAKFYPCQGNV